MREISSYEKDCDSAKQADVILAELMYARDKRGDLEKTLIDSYKARFIEITSQDALSHEELFEAQEITHALKVFGFSDDAEAADVIMGWYRTASY